MSVRFPWKGRDDQAPYESTGGDDDHGHGSHTAAIAGGASVGVAPLAEIRCIKALDGKGVGNLAHAIAALEMVATARLADPHTPMVAILSISTPANNAINAAVARLQAMGVVVIAAAGNDGKPVQNYSPASEDSAITVGAIQPPLPPGTSIFIPEKGDKREAYSNQVSKEGGMEGGRESGREVAQVREGGRNG
jgi:subtilisin family serine protease